MPSDIANSCFQELPCVASLQTLEKNTSAAHNQTYPATGINNHPSLPGGAAAARPLLTAAHGVGAGEEQGVQDKIDVYFSTFAKSMAGFGAFLAGDKEIIRYLKFNLRSQIFAKSLTMPMVIGGLKRLELLRTRPEIKAKLWENVHKLQGGLRERGFNIGDTNTCVTPVMMEGTPVEATLLVKDLRENYGIFTSVVVYPVIPKGMILLRLIPTASHTDAEINETLAAFEGIHEKLVSGHYKQEAEKLLKENNLSFKPI